MRTHVPTSPGRGIAVLLLAVVAATICVLGLGPVPAASAHDQLVSSTPAEGESLDAAPTSASLTFSGEIERVGIAFTLTDEGGNLLDLPTVPALDGATVSIDLPALEPGSYALAWRVVSSDGHPISGTLSFAVGVPAPVATTPATDGADGADGAGASTAQPTTPGGEALPLWAIVAIAIGGVAVIFGAVVALVGKMRRG